MLNYVKGLIYNIVLRVLAFKKANNLQKKALIIRVDEIGDYILWRKFLPELVADLHNQGYIVDFCGNHAWKSLFDLEYSGSLNNIFWLDKHSFKKKIKYRYQFLKSFRQEGYTKVVNPTYTRDTRTDDHIVIATGAKETIGVALNKVEYDLSLTVKNSVYSVLFFHPSSSLFEFYYNKEFTQFAINRPSCTNNLSFDLSKTENTSLAFINHEKYFVVFPGSRNIRRIWPTEYFVEVCNFLHNQFGWTVVVCGASGDLEQTDAFIQLYQNPLINLVCKTTLPEMLLVLKSAQCLLSNDTGTVHLAAAVDCTVFGLYNGSHYGRFAPYPKEIAKNFYAFYPDIVEKEIKDTHLLSTKYVHQVDIYSKDIPSKKVIETIKKHYEL